ncbi:hypothetical protein [Levilactobacillus acidifarinae]|uniref:Zn-Finger Containing protein n=1 Tax=Levilactobacillus acidifarinae DSM 19394 = JCM 15949 TaxID=1423715 RepID=A0A0R1LJH3_9LACO|nr:hypothetical protein [Levilactobacillus acidifarinae]KRK95997.1 hypothetical protein FD25_GL002458 [Levilactobacillus acidifarinae DSM 19394]GEO69301.1 hypothetical protein LAC03_12110 [Levilactobacillus acidifarinae]
MKPNSKFIQRLQRLMIGRYGQNDTLNRVLNGLAIVLLILSFWGKYAGWLFLVATLLIAVSYWRLFSHNIYRQVALNRGFQRFWFILIRPFSRLTYQISQHWHYRFFHCAQCHQRIRVPRHHGHVRVTCPKCGHQFDART